jgi:hypothetical protein
MRQTDETGLPVERVPADTTAVMSRSTLAAMGDTPNTGLWITF